MTTLKCEIQMKEYIIQCSTQSTSYPGKKESESRA